MEACGRKEQKEIQGVMELQDFESMTPERRAEFIGEEVEAHRKSEAMKAADENRKYYETNNPAIAERKKMYAASLEEGDTLRAVAKENKYAANEKVASSFFRDITDAKVQYLLGEGVDVTALDEGGKDAVASVFAPISTQMKRMGQESLTDALVYRFGYTYMQVINGAVTLNAVPFCEVKAYRDRYGALEAVLRHYKRGKQEFAEWHTAEKVYPFRKGDEGWEAEPERWQIQTVKAYPDGTVEEMQGRGWPRIPWFEMRHNNDGTSSLTNSAKTMIRCYDVTVSDFANNLIDMQDVFVSLKADSAYSGQDYGETLELLRNFKVAENVEGVTTFEVPYQARKVLMDTMKADIYAALRGVDVGRISGGNLTNTAIRALYSDIDLWADQAQWHIEDWAREVMEAAAWYMGVTLPPVVVKMQRRMVFDEVANMDAMARQLNVVSRKTMLENHPLVTDAQAELERIDAEEAGAAYGEGL